LQDEVFHLNSVLKYVGTSSNQVQSAREYCDEPNQGKHRHILMTVAKVTILHPTVL